MSERSLKESLEALRAEIQGIAASHPEDKDRLDRLFAELERAASAGSAASGPPSVAARAREAVLHLEVRHPRLTAIVNDVLVRLGDVGM